MALVFCLSSGASLRLHSAGLSGKYDVQRVEYAFDLQPLASRMRVTLAIGQSFDMTLADREAADRVLMMVGAVAQGARMAALVEEGEIRSLYLAVGGRE